MQGLAALTASAALVLIVDFALFLGGVDGWWRSKHVMLDNQTASKTLSSLMVLTSMAILLLFTFVTDYWIRMACYLAFFDLALAATSIQTFTERPQLLNEKTFASGYFAPPTRRQTIYALLAFLAGALAIGLPLGVTWAYKSSTTTLLTKENWSMGILQTTAFAVSLALLLACLFVIYCMKPLQWTIHTYGCFVQLSVETVGMTRKYYQVVDASEGGIFLSFSAWNSHITDTSHWGVVVVTYVPIRIWPHKNVAGSISNLQIYMTPEDPDAFLKMMSLAIQEAKSAFSVNTLPSENGSGEKTA